MQNNVYSPAMSSTLLFTKPLSNCCLAHTPPLSLLSPLTNTTHYLDETLLTQKMPPEQQKVFLNGFLDFSRIQ